VSACLGFLLGATALAVRGTPGSFRGKIVEGFPSTSAKRWIYVQGHNGAARRLDVSQTHVEYDEDVPESSRSVKPKDALTVGTEVCIMAGQGDVSDRNVPHDSSPTKLGLLLGKL